MQRTIYVHVSINLHMNENVQKVKANYMDYRTRKTYDSLINAFLQLLEKHRFEEITVRQLCESANIRRATFYTHFADKYEFLSFFIGEMRDEFASHTSKIQYEEYDKDEKFYDVIFHELIVFLEAHPQLVRNLQNSQMLSTMKEIFADEVKESVYHCLKKKTQDDETTLQMKASFYAGGILELIMLWMKDPERFKVDEVNWLDFFV